MISQYLVDRLKSAGYQIVDHSDDEVVVKDPSTANKGNGSRTEYNDVSLASDREVRRFLEVRS